jgi:transglutaminase-like putative cysteine protease
MGILRDFLDKGYIMPWKMLKITMGSLPFLLKVLVRHPIYLIKSNVESKNLKEDYYPKRTYEIPEYKPTMKYVRSNEKYLRPTHLCNPYAKEIIAMANKLGAFKKSDREYVESAFKFVKNNIKLAFVGMDREVDTLRRGSGTCIQQLSLLIALCRAAGIKARYRLYSLAVVEPIYQNQVAISPLMKEWYDAIGTFMLHGDAEIYVDGRWIIADPTYSPEYEAALGLPLAKLGDSPFGVWNYPVEGTIMTLEGLPYGIAFGWNFMVNWLAPGERLKINKNLDKAREIGRKILRRETPTKYDIKVREKYKMKIPKVTLRRSPNLVFV